MVTVKDVFSSLEQIVPTRLKMDFDNPGFLAGSGDQTVSKILLSLDITSAVIQEASDWGAELIISHHPLFFETQNVSTENLTGRKLVSLLRSGLSAICLHTNLDSVMGGVNDALMDALGAHTEGILDPAGTAENGQPYGLGRYGTVEECSLGSFLSHCKTALHANGLRYVSGQRNVHRIAVCGGSGGNLLETAVKLGCDTFITGDVKHSVFLDAQEYGVNLIDAGHFTTENVVMPVLESLLHREFPEMETRLSCIHSQPEQFL